MTLRKFYISLLAYIELELITDIDYFSYQIHVALK
jgi:hypothetical protein